MLASSATLNRSAPACLCLPARLPAVAMEPGLRFAIREGGRTVGAGVVAEIIE